MAIRLSSLRPGRFYTSQKHFSGTHFCWRLSISQGLVQLEEVGELIKVIHLIRSTKSVQVTFTLRKERCPVIHINNTVIPQSPTAKYLGLQLDSRLMWTQHITKKRKQIDLKIEDLYWVIRRKSPALLESKVLLYKTIVKPISTYGIKLWGCTSKSHIARMLQSQSKILQMITNAPWYVTNQMIHQGCHPREKYKPSRQTRKP
jgi:hypothetical protein